MDWMQSPRQALTELFKRPLPLDIHAYVAEIKIRLQEARQYDPIVNMSMTTCEARVFRGVHDVTREDLYAVMAYNLLTAKTRLDNLVLEGFARQLAKPLMHKDDAGS